MADDPQDHAGTDGVLGNLPATRPGRRSTRRAAAPSDPVEAEEPNPPRARADAAGAAPKAGAKTTGAKADGAKTGRAKAGGAKAGGTTAGAARAGGAKAGGTKTGAAKTSGTKTSAAKTTGPQAAAKAGATKASATKRGATQPGAKAAGAPGPPKRASGRPEANRSVRRGPAPDAPPVPPAPRSGWATPRTEDGAADGGGGLTGLVGGAVQGGERLVRGVLGRIVRR